MKLPQVERDSMPDLNQVQPDLNQAPQSQGITPTQDELQNGFYDRNRALAYVHQQLREWKNLISLGIEEQGDRFIPTWNVFD